MRYLSLIIIGTDQSKTNLSHFVGRTAKGGTLPPVLYIQADNCWRENKNKSFCELLVHMKVFQEVHLSFLYVGHTHEDIDAGFSKIADSLRQNDTETIPELLDLLPNPSNLIWQYDIRNWLEPFIADVRKHTKPLHYKFTMAEVSNKIKLCYKSNHAGPWKISTSGMFMFNEKGEVELPKGVPKVSTPVFDKISIEKIESGINDWKCLFTDQIEHHQFNWWKSRVNYMKKLRDDNQFMKSEIIQKAVWYFDKLPKIRVTPDCSYDNNPPKEIEDMVNQELIEHEIQITQKRKRKQSEQDKTRPELKKQKNGKKGTLLNSSCNSVIWNEIRRT
ncbi:uncharacterized protein LOC134694252 [Mytilus trossulus]|uniref:uncharacterized protein LOC134694252 n=1 Tax=Mytilus trossulus TaxID=6551 RepID=UPI0030077A18